MFPRWGQVKGVHNQALILWNIKETYVRKRRLSQIWRVKWQQTHNYQQLNLKQKQTKETTRTGTNSQKWRSHGGLSVGIGVQENRGKGTGNKKHNC